MTNISIFAVILPLLVSPGLGQFTDLEPRICGTPGGLPPVRLDFHVNTEASTGGGSLWVGSGLSVTRIALPPVVDAIEQLCPLSDGRLMIFAETGSAEHVFIVDPVKGVLLDSFYGSDPVISPDQRRMAYRKFYPRYHELEVSEEYLLYDLSKTAAQNRPGGDVDNMMDVGSTIFPLGQKNLPGDHIGVTPEQQHSNTSLLYWAPDSRAVVFGDRLSNTPAVVQIKIGDSGQTEALVHELDREEVCENPANSVGERYPIRIAQVNFGMGDSGVEAILVDMEPGEGTCRPKMLQLHRKDFKPAKREVHVIEKPKRGMIGDGKQVEK